MDAIEGVTCDVCHKVTDVLVGKNQLPYDDRPGVLSMSMLRPVLAPALNTGPSAYQTLLDTNSKRICYPVFSESKFCAACHYGKFANTLIYGSYQEWLEAIANPEVVIAPARIVICLKQIKLGPHLESIEMPALE
jgi:hypothetical protein